jgi:hypothetical protein
VHQEHAVAERANDNDKKCVRLITDHDEPQKNDESTEKFTEMTEGRCVVGVFVDEEQGGAGDTARKHAVDAMLLLLKMVVFIEMGVCV